MLLDQVHKKLNLSCYESYLNKKLSLTTIAKLDLDALKKLQIEKYVFIRDLIDDALKTKKDWSEGEWQQLMLSA